MKPACQISAEALRLGGEAVKPGVTTAQIDKIIYDYIVSQGARPNFKGLGGFPGSACISVNDVVIHGIPSHGIVLHEGDIVSIDTGAAVHGWNGDNAATFACGEVSETAQRLMDVTKEALMRGIAAAQTGNRVGDISAAVQQYAGGRRLFRRAHLRRPRRGPRAARRPGGAELRHGGARAAPRERDGACHRTDGKRKKPRRKNHVRRMDDQDR